MAPLWLPYTQPHTSQYAKHYPHTHRNICTIHSHIYIFNNFKVVPFIGRASLLLASADSGLGNLRQSSKL